MTGRVEGLLVGSSLGAELVGGVAEGSLLNVGGTVARRVGLAVGNWVGKYVDEVGEYDGIADVGFIDDGDAVGPPFSGTVYEIPPWLC